MEVEKVVEKIVEKEVIKEVPGPERVVEKVVEKEVPGATVEKCVPNMPAAQIGELLHRRSHLGIAKLRAMAHTTADAPRSAASATACSCASCAASRSRTCRARRRSS